MTSSESKLEMVLAELIQIVDTLRLQIVDNQLVHR